MDSKNSGRQPSPITHEQLRAFIPRYEAAWTARTAPSHPLEELVTEDIVWEDPLLPQPAQGHAGVRQFLDGTLRAFPDLTCESKEAPYLSGDGTRVLYHWRMTGTLRGALRNGAPPTGKSFVLEGVDTWDFRDGRICRYRAYYDLFGLMRQLGLVPG